MQVALTETCLRHESCEFYALRCEWRLAGAPLQAGVIDIEHAARGLNLRIASSVS